MPQCRFTLSVRPNFFSGLWDALAFTGKVPRFGEEMLQIPVLVLVLIIFVLVVFASAKKVHLGLAAALGGLAFALLRGISLWESLKVAILEVFRPDTLLLLMLVTLIMMFSSAMKKAGAMDAFSKALSALAPSKRIALASAPLIIGTLPMPGGAILSAPLVDAFDPQRERPNDVLSAANYWFRHNLELTWPLYPAFILTSTMSGFSVGKLIALNLYAFPVLFTLGLIFILPRTPKTDLKSDKSLSNKIPFSLKQILSGFAPLIIVIGSYVSLEILWHTVSPFLSWAPTFKGLFGRYTPIYLGLSAGALYLLKLKKTEAVFKGCITQSTLKLAAVVAGIRVFSALLEAGNVAQASAAELSTAGIPALVVAAVLPLVAGLVTGVGFGYVGLSFPIILGLFPEGGPFPREAAVVLAGAFGFAGMMLSPLHVCMVVSSEHFGTKLSATIRRFALPLGIFVILGTAYALALGALL